MVTMQVSRIYFFISLFLRSSICRFCFQVILGHLDLRLGIFGIAQTIARGLKMEEKNRFNMLIVLEIRS